MGEVIRIVYGRTHEPISDLTNRAVLGGKTVHLPIDSILARRDGQEIPVEDSTAPIHDGSGQAKGAVIIGIAMYPADGQDAAILITNADIALHQVNAGERSGTSSTSTRCCLGPWSGDPPDGCPQLRVACGSGTKPP